MLTQRLLLKTTYRSVPAKFLVGYFRTYSSSSPFSLNDKERKKAKAKSKLPWYKRWADYTQSDQFQNKTMLKIYVGCFFIASVPFYFYMRDRYHEDKQMKHIDAKYAKDPSSLSEYEYLVLKSLNNLEKLRPLELKKYKLYQLMRKEFRRKNLFNQEMFNPSPQELNDWYQQQSRYI